MKCYYHRDIEAIGICKSCQKGLCEKCAVDISPGLACINSCEEEVSSLNEVLERSKSAYQKTGSAYRRNGLSMLLAGLVFLLIGVLPIIISGEYGSSFIALLGLIFLLWSFFSYRSAKQIESSDKNA
ncbi:hypothetical protein [Microbulbifer aestuariivivens]|uniref:hypothetical protein n=1 Tax=Microbulbifer aestuariivivens TaxID=1908308 RepID=UPI0031EFD1B2